MSYIGWVVLLICFTVSGSMFFSVNAASLRIFSRVKLIDAFKAANKKSSPEDFLDKLVENAERLVLTCSLYRFIFNMSVLLVLLVLLSAFRQAGPHIIDYLFTFVIATAIFLVFSLAIPHAWAKYAGEKVLIRTYRLLIFFAILAQPLLYIIHLYDRLIKRLAGVADTTLLQQQEERQEEFLTGLDQHRIEGAVDREEQDMIENVLQLSDTAANEIMTPRTDIVAIEVNSGLDAVVQTINAAGHTRVPVYEVNIDNIIGFVYAKDLLSEIGKDPDQFSLRNKMRTAYFVPETKPLRVLLHEFKTQKLHIAVVLDEYGGTAGIITLEDILEELVGEISDEYEKSPKESIKKIDHNTIEVDARAYIDDLNDQFELSLPDDEDYDTVGGFVLSHLGYIPKAEDSFNYKNLNFRISSAEARRIKRIRIQKVTER
jgi:putative hemolysin